MLTYALLDVRKAAELEEKIRAVDWTVRPAEPGWQYPDA